MSYYQDADDNAEWIQEDINDQELVRASEMNWTETLSYAIDVFLPTNNIPWFIRRTPLKPLNLRSDLLRYASCNMMRWEVPCQ